MRTSARVAATLLTTTIVVGGTAAAASAQATSVKDSRGDVMSYASFDDEVGARLSTADSAASGVDIRSVKVDHGKKKVTVTVKLVNLKSDTTISAAVRPDTKKQPNRFVINTSRRSGVVYDAKGNATCTATFKTKLGSNGYAKASIKRSCLGNPKKIRVNASAYLLSENGAVVIDTLSKGDPENPRYTKALKAS